MASSWQPQDAQAPGKAEHTYTPAQRPGDLHHHVSPVGTARPPVCKPGCLFATPTFSAPGQGGNTPAENRQPNCYCRENRNTWAFRRTYTHPEEPKPISLSSSLTFSPDFSSSQLFSHPAPTTDTQCSGLQTHHSSLCQGGQIACPAFLWCSHCSANHSNFCNTTDSRCLCQAITTAPMAQDLLACYRSIHAAHHHTISQLSL